MKSSISQNQKNLNNSATIENILFLSDTQEIELKELTPFPEQDVFPPMAPAQFEILIDSLRKDGFYQPLLIAQKGLIHNDKYTILSGHNRFNAACQLGLKTVPCRIVDFLPSYQKLPKDVKYRVLKEIFLDSNLAQRILDPDTYLKCIQIREANQYRTSLDSLKSQLIPEFQKALEEGKLSVHLARALARVPLNEQKDFFFLIGMQVSGTSQVKIQKLQENLEKLKIEYRETVKKLERTEKTLSSKSKEVQELKILLSNLEKEKNKYYHELLKLRGELHSKTTDEEKIKELKRQIADLEKKILEKEEEITTSKEKIAMLEAQFLEMEEQYKQEKERIRQEMQQRLEQEVKKAREQKKLSKTNPENVPKGLELMILCKRLTEWLTNIFSETWGSGEEFDQEIKEQFIQHLEDLELAIQNAKDALTGKQSLFKDMWSMEINVTN
jgi:predicted  nucleic acid-binding Zn-ribbon protein